jgi:hypothetical protein
MQRYHQLVVSGTPYVYLVADPCPTGLANLQL